MKLATRVCGQKYASDGIASAVDRGASSGTCSGVAFPVSAACDASSGSAEWLVNTCRGREYSRRREP